MASGSQKGGGQRLLSFPLGGPWTPSGIQWELGTLHTETWAPAQVGAQALTSRTWQEKTEGGPGPSPGGHLWSISACSRRQDEVWVSTLGAFPACGSPGFLAPSAQLPTCRRPECDSCWGWSGRTHGAAGLLPLGRLDPGQAGQSCSGFPSGRCSSWALPALYRPPTPPRGPVP